MFVWGVGYFNGGRSPSRVLEARGGSRPRTECGAAAAAAAWAARRAEEAGVSGVCRASNRRPEAKVAWAVVSTRLRIAWAARAGLWPSERRVRHGRGRRQWAASHHFYKKPLSDFLYLLTYKGPSRSDGNGRGPGALCPAAHTYVLSCPVSVRRATQPSTSMMMRLMR